MRILTNEDVERVLDPEECLRVLEVAYQEHATGAAANRPRNHTYFPVEDPRHPGFRYRFKSQEGGNVSSAVWRCGSPPTWPGWRCSPAASGAGACFPSPPAAPSAG